MRLVDLLATTPPPEGVGPEILDGLEPPAGLKPRPAAAFRRGVDTLRRRWHDTPPPDRIEESTRLQLAHLDIPAEKRRAFVDVRVYGPCPQYRLFAQWADRARAKRDQNAGDERWYWQGVLAAANRGLSWWLERPETQEAWNDAVRARLHAELDALEARR